MKKILIVGGGFAGLSSARVFSKSGLELDITLVDRKATSDFLPTLPDCLGRGIDPGFLAYPIADAAKRMKIKFIHDEISAVNFEKKEAVMKTAVIGYDYLLIASGSETNFYSNENIRQNAFKMDGAADASRLRGVLKAKIFSTYIIAGGGYTGIEVATNLRLFSRKNKKEAAIVIIERAPQILGPLAQWMKDYVAGNLKYLNIEVLTDTSIERIEENMVYASRGRAFENALVVWAAGVKTGTFIQDLKLEKNPQGRIKVDEYLKINDSCFVAGDAAYFARKNIYLRMAVQFAIVQGEIAARNIMNSIKGRNLVKYRPLDLGYIIPMANNRSCGRILFINMKGLLPTIFHFIMCIYRSRGLRNKKGILQGLITGGKR